MRWIWMIGVVGALAVAPGMGNAAEHGGKEHGGATASNEPAGQTQEHAGQTAQVEPSAEQLRQAIRDYIAQVEQDEGAFTIEDEATEGIRTLTLVQVHERVGKTGDLYYSCTDMRDVDTGELLDLDFDVEAKDGELNVVDERIHKVNDPVSYTHLTLPTTPYV